MCNAISLSKRMKSCKIRTFLYYSKWNNHFKNCTKSIQDVIYCDSTLENSRKKKDKTQVDYQHSQRLFGQWGWDKLEFQKCDSTTEGWGSLPKFLVLPTSTWVGSGLAQDERFHCQKESNRLLVLLHTYICVYLFIFWWLCPLQGKRPIDT